MTDHKESMTENSNVTSCFTLKYSRTLFRYLMSTTTGNNAVSQENVFNLKDALIEEYGRLHESKINFLLNTSTEIDRLRSAFT